MRMSQLPGLPDQQDRPVTATGVDAAGQAVIPELLQYPCSVQQQPLAAGRGGVKKRKDRPSE
jgi:hypothetical protein